MLFFLYFLQCGLLYLSEEKRKINVTVLSMAHSSHEKRENTLCKKKKKTLNVNDVDN